MTVLFSAEQIARTSYLKVTQRDSEARTELSVFADRRESFFRNLRQLLAAAVR